MRTLWKMIFAAVFLALVTPGLLLAVGGQKSPLVSSLSQQSLRPQTTCPVMGGAIDKSIYVDANGKRIYLCCAGCENAVRTEPERYIKKIEKRGESVEDTL